MSVLPCCGHSSLLHGQTRCTALSCECVGGKVEQDPHLKSLSEDFDYAPRAVARRGDPETSHEAARSVRGIRESQAKVLAILRRDGPMTDEELFDVLSHNGLRLASPSGARTRRSELVKLGMVEDSGERRVGPTGRRMIVWRAVAREEAA